MLTKIAKILVVPPPLKMRRCQKFKLFSPISPPSPMLVNQSYAFIFSQLEQQVSLKFLNIGSSLSWETDSAFNSTYNIGGDHLHGCHSNLFSMLAIRRWLINQLEQNTCYLISLCRQLLCQSFRMRIQIFKNRFDFKFKWEKWIFIITLWMDLSKWSLCHCRRNVSKLRSFLFWPHFLKSDILHFEWLRVAKTTTRQRGDVFGNVLDSNQMHSH